MGSGSPRYLVRVRLGLGLGLVVGLGLGVGLGVGLGLGVGVGLGLVGDLHLQAPPRQCTPCRRRPRRPSQRCTCRYPGGPGTARTCRAGSSIACAVSEAARAVSALPPRACTRRYTRGLWRELWSAGPSAMKKSLKSAGLPAAGAVALHARAHFEPQRGRGDVSFAVPGNQCFEEQGCYRRGRGEV